MEMKVVILENNTTKKVEMMPIKNAKLLKLVAQHLPTEN